MYRHTLLARKYGKISETFSFAKPEPPLSIPGAIIIFVYSFRGVGFKRKLRGKVIEVGRFFHPSPKLPHQPTNQPPFLSRYITFLPNLAQKKKKKIHHKHNGQSNTFTCNSYVFSPFIPPSNWSWPSIPLKPQNNLRSQPKPHKECRTKSCRLCLFVHRNDQLRK